MFGTNLKDFLVSRKKCALLLLMMHTGVVLASPAPPTNDGQIEKYLDAIDTQVFFDSVRGPMSDSMGVKSAALDRIEIKYLIQHASQSIPAMLRRLKTPDAVHVDNTRILYFIVFEKAKDTRVMPVLADYLESTSNSAEQHAGANSPFEYAFWASCSFIDCDAIRQKYNNLDAVYNARHEVAEELRAGYKQRTPPEKARTPRKKPAS